MKDPEQSTLHVSRSAERALMLLDTVISGGSVSLSQAARATEIAPSTALRHLRALAQFGYLVRDQSGQYSVGPTFIRIALAAFRSGPYARLTAAAQPQLEHLATITEESVYLAVRDGTMAVYIATVESPRAIRHVGWVGRSVPIEGTAVGAALAATQRGRPARSRHTHRSAPTVRPAKINRSRTASAWPAPVSSRIVPPGRNADCARAAMRR